MRARKLTTVTQIIQDIGTCRNLIATGEQKRVLAHIHIFEKVCNGVKIDLDRFIKDPEYELDFTFYDLKELSDEIYEFLKEYPQKFLTDECVNQVNDLEYIDNDVLRKYNQSCCDTMYVDTKLRECYKILSYCAVTMYLWGLSRGENVLE